MHDRLRVLEENLAELLHFKKKYGIETVKMEKLTCPVLKIRNLEW